MTERATKISKGNMKEGEEKGRRTRTVGERRRGPEENEGSKRRQ